MKTVQNVKNSLKFKAQEKEGVLTIRVGVRKYAVPVKARMLSGQDYLFLSFPASSELYKVSAKELAPLDKETDAADAYEALNPGKRRGRRRGGGVEMPTELAEALKNLPAGYKLGYTVDGAPKLVRTRRRSKE
ncbi:hypothetical protein OP10G_4345 [Fimbriimonas ginsengisoli Gsoil 348]|uniref:Uncharacterized protein n=1 Tax=Fimbriimonas ginsengisoli Gsoil 348 TaxID=661478 RepID=A0A068NW11_FIMGI|nr:hypothetical protein OP10G_4345 [Fimbriimonas ginsengisoli Gsoil 348]